MCLPLLYCKENPWWSDSSPGSHLTRKHHPFNCHPHALSPCCVCREQFSPGHSHRSLPTHFLPPLLSQSLLTSLWILTIILHQCLGSFSQLVFKTKTAYPRNIVSPAMNSRIAIPGLPGKHHPVSSTMAQVSSLIPRKTGLPFLSSWAFGTPTWCSYFFHQPSLPCFHLFMLQ